MGRQVVSFIEPCALAAQIRVYGASLTLVHGENDIWYSWLGNNVPVPKRCASSRMVLSVTDPFVFSLLSLKTSTKHIYIK